MDWSRLAGWWLEELAGDPAYQEEVLPLALELLNPQPAKTYLDVGCGEGRVMAAIVKRGATALGVDASAELLERAARFGPVTRAEVPPLDFQPNDSVDGVVIVLVLEHLQDVEAVLAESARVTRPGGTLAVVVNHPVWTAPGSSPVLDAGGEILWRPGDYLLAGWSDEPAGDEKIRFHHRPMGELLTTAARSGWSLERMTEAGVTAEQIQRTPGLTGQEHIPRLLGVRWVRG